MLATLVPMFKEDMSVGAYCLFAQRENLFQNPHLLGSGRFDGAGNIVGIEVLNSVTLDDLSKGNDIVVPVNNISVFADIKGAFNGPADRIMLLGDPTIKPEESYKKRLAQLKADGFKFALKKLSPMDAESYKPILEYVDLLFVDCGMADPIKQAMIFNKIMPTLKLAVENIPSQEEFEKLKESKKFVLFEGDFYRIPINKKDTEVSPLKINYLKLLDIINKPDFDLTKVADVIAKDPALTIQLLDIVNKLTINSNISSIKQATALLGQKELKRWLNTSVLSNLCKDKPNEITRLSLVRARFAENLAGIFDLSMRTEELFLMGLFSVLDYILDKPMEEALKSVGVSKAIYDALSFREGDLAPVIDFEVAYEAANWQEVSRVMVLKSISMNDVYEAYLSALKWYKDMFM